jgi:hypothetical protein
MRSKFFLSLIAVALLQGAASAQTAKQGESLPSGWVEETDNVVQQPSQEDVQRAQRGYQALQQVRPQRPPVPVQPSTNRIGGPSSTYQRYYNQFFADDAVDKEDDEGFGTIFGGKRRARQQAAPFNMMGGPVMQQNYGGTFVTPFNQRTIQGTQTQQGFGAPMYVGPEFPNPYLGVGPAYVPPGYMPTYPMTTPYAPPMNTFGYPTTPYVQPGAGLPVVPPVNTGRMSF